MSVSAASVNINTLIMYRRISLPEKPDGAPFRQSGSAGSANARPAGSVAAITHDNAAILASLRIGILPPHEWTFLTLYSKLRITKNCLFEEISAREKPA